MGTIKRGFANNILTSGNFDATALTGTLPSSNINSSSLPFGWIEYAGGSTASTATHVISLPWASDTTVIKIFWSAGMLGNQSLVFSASTDNFSTVTNMDGMYSYFQLGTGDSPSNGNVSEPNDGLNEQYIKITANQTSGDSVKGETTLTGSSFHSNGSASRRNQFSWRTETVTHQGTGVYIERVFSHGQVARALAGSESTMPTHVRYHELSGNNIDFSYRAFYLKDNN